MVADIKKAVAYVEREKELADPLKTKFAAINRTAALKQKFQQLSRNEEGVHLVREEIANLFSILELKIAELRGVLPFPITRDRFQPESFIMVYGPSTPSAPDGTRMTLTLRFDIRKIYVNDVAEATMEQRIYFQITDFLSDEYRGMGLIAERIYSPFFTENDQVVWLDQTRAAFSSADVVRQALMGFGGFVQEVQEGRPMTWHFVEPRGFGSQ